jgi:PAS domain-containing protein
MPSGYRARSRPGYEVRMTAEGPDPDEAARVAVAMGADADAPWTATRIGRHVAGATVGLWRVEGAGWRAVCKVAAHSDHGHERWRTSEAVTDPWFWRREPDAYCSGFLRRVVDESASGLRTPGVLACVDRDDGSTATWLEDVRGLPGGEWPFIGHPAASRALGRLQGALVVEDALPTEPWLSRGWLRSYVARAAPVTDQLLDDDLWRDVPAQVRDIAALRDAFLRLRELQPRLLDALDALPRTLCHLDFYPDNMIGVTTRDGESRVVLIDWAYCGIGALGEDIGNQVPDTMADCFVEPSAGPMLEQMCGAAYLLGLADAGWQGDERLVRLGYAAGAAVKLTWLLPRQLEIGRDDEAMAASPGFRGFAIEEVVRRRTEVCALLPPLGEEAVRLADELGL